MENHYIAVVRPDALFDLSTLTTPDPEDRETSIKGFHVIRRERSTYAHVYGKRKFPERLARGMVNNAPELYRERDEADLKALEAAQH
ncbi:MAG: hypothetical protein HY319_15200 [Armatimonadetes bacterium]|nr:hypothetical protein [Armatimonadota bacterium]